MMLIKWSFISAAMISLLASGIASGQANIRRSEKLPGTMQIGQTRYIVEMDDKNPSPVLLLLRERETDKVIGTISFNHNGNMASIGVRDTSANPTIVGLRNGNGGTVSGPNANRPSNKNGLIGGSGLVNRNNKDNKADLLDELDNEVPGGIADSGGSLNGGKPDNSSPATLPVPEPSAVVLSAAGLIIIGLLKLRQVKA